MLNACNICRDCVCVCVCGGGGGGLCSLYYDMWLNIPIPGKDLNLSQIYIELHAHV